MRDQRRHAAVEREGRPHIHFRCGGALVYSKELRVPGHALRRRCVPRGYEIDRGEEHCAGVLTRFGES